MVGDSDRTLVEIEKYLIDAIQDNIYLSYWDLDPPLIVRHIADDLVRKRFIWLGKQTYVPNRLFVKLPLRHPDKLAAMELVLTSPKFIRLLSQYIAKCGFKLFGPLEVKVNIGRKGERWRNSNFTVECCWSEEKHFAIDIDVGEEQAAVDLEPRVRVEHSVATEFLSG